MASLMEKLLQSSSIKGSDVFSESEFIASSKPSDTGVYLMNIALSGKIDGGLRTGITSFAGPSRHFKTGFCLLCVSAYLKQYDDAICLFYDSEKGAAKEFFSAYDIDDSRVLHSPISDIEELKFDLVKQLDQIEKGEHVIIFIDSLGLLASKKEVKDAEDGNSAADMTRAKELKSFWRITTPRINNKDLPVVVVQHTYQEMGLYPKTIMSGGQGNMLTSNSVFIIGKRQVKDGKEFLGSEFVLNVEKSRYIKEKTAIPITITYESGIDKYSGLLEVAQIAGVVSKPSKGWYSRVIVKDDKKWRANETNCAEFWEPILNNPSQVQLIEKLFSLSSNSLLNSDVLGEIEIDEDTGEVL